MNKRRLENYAKLIVKKGINLKPGQDVVIRADLDRPEFVKLVVETAYNAGARKVEVEWDYQPLTVLHINSRSVETLKDIPQWEIDKLSYRRDTLPAMIYLLSEDPDGLQGIDREKHAISVQERYKKIKAIRDDMENKYQWCIAAVPGLKWAKKMFPGVSDDEAIELQWQAILDTSRVDDDPLAAWDDHNKELKKRCDYLNSLGIKKLHYTDPNGTDFTVGLMDNALFLGGGEYTLSGNFFNPNIPSEEVFITPKRGEAEGIVYSSRPFCYRGELIEDFYIRFKDGRAVEWDAKKNKELLTPLINMDEGAHYLGECALVPHDSPISNSGLLFYNTLFDENAACHLAIGEGFSNCIKDYDKYTLEECRKMGVNESMIHEDFMIGTATLNITAILKDGSEVAIFKNGNWA